MPTAPNSFSVNQKFKHVGKVDNVTGNFCNEKEDVQQLKSFQNSPSFNNVTNQIMFKVYY